MHITDFFQEHSASGTDQARLNDSLLLAILKDQDVGRSDVEVAEALAQLVREELTAYGTDGRPRTDNDEIKQLIRTMKVVSRRIGVEVSLPFRDYETFHGYWVKSGAYGNWQARRDIVNELFEPMQSQIEHLVAQDVSGVGGRLRTLPIGDSQRAVKGFLAGIDELREHRIDLADMEMAGIYPTDILRHDQTREIEGDLLRLLQGMKAIAREVSDATGIQVVFSGSDWDENYAEAAKMLGLLDRMVDFEDAVDLPLDGVSDPAAIREQLERLNSIRDSDPHQVISYAKSLIESTCKVVLKELNRPYDEKSTIPTLIKAAQKALKMHPDTIAPTQKGRATTIRALSNLSQVALAVAELRNEYGTDHGRTHPSDPLRPRHARLARNMATAYCEFLLDTLSDQSITSQKQALS